MKKFAIGVAAAMLVSGPALAEDVEVTESKPVTLTEAQMDAVLTQTVKGKKIDEL